MPNNPTIWCQEGELPQPGIQCPKCGRGYLNKSQYGIWCSTCKTNWKISKFPPKKVIPVGEPPAGAIKEMKPFTANIATKEDLGVIRGDIRRLERQIEEIGKKIDKSIVVYPDTPPQSNDGYKKRGLWGNKL